MKDKKQYTRKPYDAMKHCGHAIDRSAEGLAAKIAKYTAVIDELDALQKTRPLDKQESIRLKRKVISRNWQRKNLEKVEAQGPDDRPCMKTKGQGTDHPSVGFCRFHCSCKGRTDGHLTQYSRQLKDKKLQQLMDEMDASAEDILNLTPDVMLLRAKLTLFINEKQDFDPETVKSLTLIADQLRKTVETINNKKFQASITMETFNMLLFRMGEVVTKYVSEQETLEKIMLDWQKISVETTATKRSRQIGSGPGENVR